MRRFSPLYRSFLIVVFSLGIVGGLLVPTSVHAQAVDSSAAPTVETSTAAEVPFVRTPQPIVNRMLEVANVSEDDVVYDLGSGDGRIPITAALKYDARGVGIEIKPDLVQKARENAKNSGVANQVEFRQQDLFKADFRDATVVTLYLLPDVNTRLRPMLFEQLAPGTRVVSHGFDMDEWEPDRVVQVDNTYLYLWTIPEEIPAHLKPE